MFRYSSSGNPSIAPSKLALHVVQSLVSESMGIGDLRRLCKNHIEKGIALKARAAT